MKLINEFKEFAVKGNMMEMAIGIIIGASFNSVIDVLVKQILLPPLSLLSNGLNIDSKKIILREADISSSGNIINQEVAINYGFFIETFLDFMIVAFTIFIVIKFLNRLQLQAEDTNNNKIATPKNIKLLTEINESLKDLNKNLLKKFGILKEEKKPDFLDLDKDGDKEEPMADAAKSKGKKGEEKEDLEESTSGRHDDADRRQSKDREYADRLREGEEDDKSIADKKNKNKYSKTGKNFDNDPKPPKSSPPAVAEPDEDEKEKKLQESIKRIARAKRVTLNGKRIK